jgi:hypothetical protein
MPILDDRCDLENIEEEPILQIIDSYRLEEWVRRSHRSKHKGLHWRELTQYAISHCVNDYYSTAPEYRSMKAALRTMEAKWTNKVYKFDSRQHFKQIKDSVANNLSLHLSQTDSLSMPCILFEQHQTKVIELDIMFSYIVQTMFGSTQAESAYRVRSYMVDNNPEMMEACYHLTSVFCYSAFAQLPERIEIYAVLQDQLYSYSPSHQSIERSMDYMRLLHELVAEAGSTQHVPLHTALVH